mgnify:CR=1 FL=1
MFTRFAYHFFYAIWRVKSVILALIALIVAGAVAITVVEKMPFSRARMRVEMMAAYWR